MKLELKQIKPGKDLSLNGTEKHLLENLLVLYIILSLFHFIFFLYFDSKDHSMIKIQVYYCKLKKRTSQVEIQLCIRTTCFRKTLWSEIRDFYLVS